MASSELEVVVVNSHPVVMAALTERCWLRLMDETPLEKLNSSSVDMVKVSLGVEQRIGTHFVQLQLAFKHTIISKD